MRLFLATRRLVNSLTLAFEIVSVAYHLIFLMPATNTAHIHAPPNKRLSPAGVQVHAALNDSPAQAYHNSDPLSPYAF